MQNVGSDSSLLPGVDNDISDGTRRRRFYVGNKKASADGFAWSGSFACAIPENRENSREHEGDKRGVVLPFWRIRQTHLKQKSNHGSARKLPRVLAGSAGVLNSGSISPMSLRRVRTDLTSSTFTQKIQKYI